MTDEDITEKKTGLRGLFERLNEFLDVVSDLQEGAELLRQGEIRSKSGRVSGLYGMRIKTGFDGNTIFEHFGDIGTSEGRGCFTEEREPLVDIFEEQNSITIVAEIPGAFADSIELTIDDEGKHLTLKARSNERKYCKQLALPISVRNSGSHTYLNGIFSAVLLKESEKTLSA